MRVVNIDATVFDAALDDCEFPEKLMNEIKAAIEAMRDSPGGDNETIQIVISNDFEPDEESEEDDESADDKSPETPKE